MNNIIEERYTEIAMMRGHSHVVSCLTLNKNKLFSASMDKTIHIWNTETYETIATLEGHTDIVYCLTLYKNKLYSGSKDKTIRVWKV
jgi:F-box/WD-40 domain protein 7